MGHVRSAPLWLVFTLAACAAHAQPSPGANVHFTWDTCDNPVKTLTWSGQTRVRQVVSVSGYSGELSVFRVWISLATRCGFNRFWNCALGLNASADLGSHLQPVTSGPCPSVPGLQLEGQGFACLTLDGHTLLEINGSVFPPVTLDPATRYALFQIEYDLEFPPIPPECTTGTVESGQCFGQVGNDLTDVPFEAEPDFLLGWQRTAESCLPVVPALGMTWGRLKTIYR